MLDWYDGALDPRIRYYRDTDGLDFDDETEE